MGEKKRPHGSAGIHVIVMRSWWAFLRVSVFQQEFHVKLTHWKPVSYEACVSSSCCFIALRGVSLSWRVIIVRGSKRGKDCVAVGYFLSLNTC